ncbi:MAG: hypothetical protein JWN15_1747 [Firmicutes bacterium]|nr:hypothetical protein [Bacillota bacterium]
MARTCEICGGTEAEQDEKKAGAKSVMDTLFVCETCRKERQSQLEVKM